MLGHARRRGVGAGRRYCSWLLRATAAEAGVFGWVGRNRGRDAGGVARDSGQLEYAEVVGGHISEWRSIRGAAGDTETGGCVGRRAGGAASLGVGRARRRAAREVAWAHWGERASGIGDSKWTIDTARAPGHTGEEMHFGSRMARVTEVELAEDAEGDACWVEAVPEGWLFLLATGGGRGSLIGVGTAVEALLAESRLVGRQIKRLCGVLGEFVAYPRTAATLCGPGWLTCGSAAMTFDPLCGEGAGNAAREAILACAAVRAIAGGQSEEDILAEYSLRLRLGFLRHLENCREFYRRDTASAFWASELEWIERGISWTQEKLRGLGRPKFRLVGFDLERNAAEDVC